MKTLKKRFRCKCFLVNSAKFFITSFFKERSYTYFLAEYLLGLICRLGTRVSSIFQALNLFSTKLNICDSVIKAKKKYYPQRLLEECKYEQKRIITENLTDDDLEKSLSDNDYNDEMESNDESST